MFLVAFCCFFFINCDPQINDQKPVANSEITASNITVEYPEVYELANIILALTDYGKTDPWQVRKDTKYYQRMRAYFEPFENHPILTQANYSKERWEEYLSFRTDSYAFEFTNEGNLQRTSEFQAFEISAFDANIEMIQDFADVSNFRNFYAKESRYYKSILAAYKREYMLPEMRKFLEQQFGQFFDDRKYTIVLSSLVFAQNLHRDIDQTKTADFVTLAKSLAELLPLDATEKSTELHTLFTEMSHGYVGPISKQYSVEISQNFDEFIWGKDSGYVGQDYNVFDEYMTWAAFDIFNKKYFPAIAEPINADWHFVNDQRQFPYSGLFAEKLAELHANSSEASIIADLYPEILSWSKRIQGQLTKPKKVFPTAVVEVNYNEKVTLKIEFSEPMIPNSTVSAIIVDAASTSDSFIISGSDVSWADNDTVLELRLNLANYSDELTVFLNWRAMKFPLKSKKGIYLKSATSFKFAPISQ